MPRSGPHTAWILGPRAPGGARHPAHRGFTLLELLVVLFLAALLVTLAAPAGERIRASIARSSERDYILDQLAAMGREAMLRGRTYVVLPASDDAPDPESAPPGEAVHRSQAPGRDPPGVEYREPYALDLPEGWDLELDKPLVVRANGVCLGAELVLRHRGVVDVRIDLEPPYCRVDT